MVDSLVDLGRHIVEYAFGDVYTRPGLSLRDRELATVAMVAAKGGCEPQLDVHLHAARNVGLTVEELREVLIQVAPYAGFPAAPTPCAGCMPSKPTRPPSSSHQESIVGATASQDQHRRCGRPTRLSDPVASARLAPGTSG